MLLKFSIIIPIYRVEKFLCKCIDSVLFQTFTNFEIILVDDGSPDNCPEICDEYAAKDSRIKVIHKPNGGLSDARNAGLDVAKGEYVIFVDSDDWWDNKEALVKINDSLIHSNADVLIFGMKKFFTQENRMGDIRIPQKYDKGDYTLSHAQIMQQYMFNNIYVACACDKVVRRSLIEKDKQRFVKRQLSEDIEWCCKLLNKNPRIDILEEAIYVYRQQVSTSITANVGVKNIKSILDVIVRYATPETSVPLLNFLANQYVLLMTNFMRLSKADQKEFEKDIKSFWWLLDYNWYPYVRMVSRIKFLGYCITKNLLRMYYLYKRK